MRNSKVEIVAHLRAAKPVACLLLAPACNLPRERVDKQVAGLKGLQRVSNNNCMNAKFALFVPAR